MTPSSEVSSRVRFWGLVLDVDARTLARDSGEVIALTRGEFALLRFLLSHPGRAVNRDTLLSVMASRRLEPFDRSVDVLIGRLRRKIEPDPKRPRLIVTVPGEGYRFDGFAAKPAAASTKEGQGASYPQILFRIFIPVAMPGIIAATIFAFTVSCGQFLKPMAYLYTSDQMVLTVGIITELIRGDVFQWGKIMAGCVLAAAPPVIVYAFLMDYYIAGLTAGATKG